VIDYIKCRIRLVLVVPLLSGNIWATFTSNSDSEGFTWNITRYKLTPWIPNLWNCQYMAESSELIASGSTPNSEGTGRADASSTKTRIRRHREKGNCNNKIGNNQYKDRRKSSHRLWMCTQAPGDTLLTCAIYYIDSRQGRPSCRRNTQRISQKRNYR